MMDQLLYAKNHKILLLKSLLISIILNSFFCLINNIFDFSGNKQYLAVNILTLLKFALNIKLALYIKSKNKIIFENKKFEKKEILNVIIGLTTTFILFGLFGDELVIFYVNLQEIIYYNTGIHSILMISDFLSTLIFMTLVFFIKK